MTEYTCARCKGVFVSDWPDEEAYAEREQVFGGTRQKTDAKLCDDCYRIFMAWFDKQPEPTGNNLYLSPWAVPDKEDGDV